MSRDKGADGPEDVDATFAEMVADLRAEGIGSIAGNAAGLESAKPEKSHREPVPDEDTGWRGGGSKWDSTMFSEDPAADEHFIPPEPPPLPRPRKSAFIVLLVFVVGLLLLIAPQLMGLSSTVGSPLGILAMATGLVLLLLRVQQGPPPGADPSNGAQL